MQTQGIEITREAQAHLALARATRTRLRLTTGVATFAKWLPWGVLFLTPLAISYRFGFVSVTLWGSSLAGVGLGLLALTWRAMARGPGLLDAALRLDAAHELKGRLAAALEYAGAFGKRRGSVEDDGYVSVILADARDLGALSPKKAAPVALPSNLGWGAAMALCLVGLLAVPDQPAAVTALTPPPESEEPQKAWLHEDDAELLEAAAEKLQESAQSDDAKDAAARFNEIVLKAAAGDIDQAEAFRLAAELQADLDAAGEQARELSEGLDKRGASLEKRKMTRSLGRALQDRKYQDAEAALKKLAERMAQGSESLSKEELDELRESIEEMRGEIQDVNSKEAQASAADEAERKSLEQRQKRLLKKKQEGSLSKAERQEMAQNERRLKRLDRRKKQKSAQQTLSELDKQLAQAAQELNKEQKKAGEFMQQAARTLSRGTQKKLSDKEKKELIKQLKALKERLRRQNKDGKQAERLRKFLDRARGQKGGQGKPGQGKPGQGKPGQGQGQMKLGPNGVPIPIPGQGSGPGQDGEGQGESSGQGGKKPGHAHDSNLQGEESRLDGAGTQDTNAVAQDTGQGQSASETILSVAEEGFTSSSYEKLYREYETVAEEVMEKESVPVGRKAHILRYFELIRPRGERAETPPEPAQGEK